MKRLVAAAMLAIALTLSAPVMAQTTTGRPEEIGDQYEDAFSNPLRLAYYLIYPAGFTIEWLVMRPFHYVVSRPYLDRFFGYTPIGEEGTYTRMGDRM